jgi:ATP-dependent Lon protease
MPEVNSLQNQNLSLPLLITRGLIVFPNMSETIEVSRLFSMAAVDQAKNVTNSLALRGRSRITPKSKIRPRKTSMRSAPFAASSTYVSQNKSYRIRVVGSKRVKLTNIHLEGGTFLADGEIMEDVLGDRNEEIALVRKVVEALENSPSIGRDIPKSALNQLGKGIAANELSDTLAAYLPITLEQKEKILSEPAVNARLTEMLSIIAEQKEIDAIDEKLNDTVRERAEKSQKEYFLARENEGHQGRTRGRGRRYRGKRRLDQSQKLEIATPILISVKDRVKTTNSIVLK